jgi:hypothetical protein
MSWAEEEHARILLSGDLGVDFSHHDDGSGPSMPDLLSADGRHVAEVITTTRSAAREAEHHLDPVAEPKLPHCVWVMVPYSILGGTSKDVRFRVVADVVRWTSRTGCDSHWSSSGVQRSLRGVDPNPILPLGAYDDGVQVVCVQLCQHPDGEPHQVKWSVLHSPSPDDPWTLIRQSLHIVGMEQRGGVQALAKKLNGYPHKHLVMYPFGPPGNLTAAISSYVLPGNVLDLMPAKLNPPLGDIHLWLVYQYGNGDDTEGLHLCNGHWAKFGTAIPALDSTSFLRRFHYPDR